MPRVADHQARRALVTQTFQRHVAEHGLAATTFARVAAAAGVSVGLIQHYFTDREELLRVVYTDVLERRDDRIALHIAEGEAARRPIREIIATAVRELVPLDEARTQEFHVTQVLLTEALHDPTLAEVAARADRDLLLRTAVAVTNGKACGEVATEVDDEVAASRILATAYGLATRVALAGPGSPTGRPEHVDGVLAPVLGTVFTARCRHYDDRRQGET